MVKRPDRFLYYRNLCKPCKSLRNQTDSVKQLNKEYFENNKSAIYSQRQLRKQNNVNERLADSLRSRLYQAIKNSYKTGSAVRDLGCSIEELRIYLESKFQSGMSWNKRIEWHIDHITPLSTFNLEDREQLLKACNYSNLQPLWAKDNLSKGGKV